MKLKVDGLGKVDDGVGKESVYRISLKPELAL